MYNHKEIEKKWQEFWEKNKTFKIENNFSKLKYYCLDMFPYPSGAGLHVGHPEGMTANDIIARYKNANGFNVLHPMGWDAFGLPAENYAIKTGTHPRITTDNNINTFRRQLKTLGFSYDWDREIDTTDPKYYKWTQWIFLKLFEQGLAYEQDLPINYCPSCKTGLANEEVLNDFTCDRCGTKVEKKKIRQWVLAITKYADRLLTDVDRLDWPEGIKDMQRNWIGKSEGCEFEMKRSILHPNPLLGEETEQEHSIRVYTTRIDTVFGMTYAVLAPDHKDVADFIMPEYKKECLKYIEDATKQSDQDRTADNKEKTGVFTGSYVINPFNGKKVPLWIADYILGNYGTGAVMAVPAHDERDFEFAKKYNLEIKTSIIPTGRVSAPNINLSEIIYEKEKNILLSKYSYLDSKTNAHFYFKHDKEYELDRKIENLLNIFKDKNIASESILSDLIENSLLIDSGEFSGLTSAEAKIKMTNFAETQGFGHKKVNYKLRDWLFSRQRYWGEPIPLIHISNEDFEKLPRIEFLSEIKDEKLAYIVDKKGTTKRCKDCDCDDNGCTKLIINGKTFSKIYNGLYGKIVCDYRLPLELPEVEEYAPSGDGHSPLVKVDNFVNIKLADNLYGKRETNTMPQWGGSCWYYLRFMDPNNDKEIVDKNIVNYWGEVDSYVGGAEHAVLHLLYARFWHKFLFDIGIVPTNEPFYRLRNQGLILAHAFQRKNGGLLANDLVEEKDGKYYEIESGEEVNRIISKMSKSLKNVINPDDIVQEYGADSLRLYEMYMAEFKDTAPWDTKSITGVRRFIEKSERLFTFEAKKTLESDEFTMKLLHKTIKKIGEDIENYKFNTSIAALMILVNNGLPNDEKLELEWKKIFVVLLGVFAPHIGEELSQRIGNKQSLFFISWPKYDLKMTIDDTIEIGIQVLGKLRGTIQISKDATKDEVLKLVKENLDVSKWLIGKEIVKEIYIPGRIVNLVIR